MKITKIESIPLRYDMDEPIWDAQHYIPARQALIVRVYTDEGIVGIGESASFGGPMVSTKTVIDKELAPFFIGEDPFHIERLWEKVYQTTIQHGRKGIVIAALSGIDIAIWDILGKATNTPLYKLLGASRDKVAAYASCGFYSEQKGIQELCVEMETAISKGHKMVKMKVGGLSIQEDYNRIKAVREAIGGDIDLAIDANSNWTVPEAMQMSRKVEDLNIRWIEEPVAVDDIEGSARVANQTIIPIAGYEQEVSRFGFKHLIEKNAIHIVQPDVIWSGGITETKKIATLASAWHLQCIPHVFSSGVCLAANLQFIASITNGSLLEYDQNKNPLRNELINDALFADSEGFVHLPNKPGIGIDVNEKVVEKYKLN